MRARYYHPYLNRWIQPDTIVPDPANPQSLNRFSYVLGNPLKYTDPSGHYGRRVHYELIYEIVRQAALSVYGAGLPEVGSHNPSLNPADWATQIASLDQGVDDFGRWDVTGITPSRGREGERTPAGEIPEEYWHFASRADAETRLANAILACDATAFGMALHTYQDYYSHTRSGYSYASGSAGIAELHEKCPECYAGLDSEGVQEMDRRASKYWGHFLAPGNTDAYSSSNLRDIMMEEGTKYWVLVWFLVYYGVPLDEWTTLGIDPRLYLVRSGQPLPSTGPTIRLERQ